jgi:hypothetical protein
MTSAALALMLFTGGTPTVLAERDIDGDGLSDMQEDANGNNFVDANETNPYDANPCLIRAGSDKVLCAM